MNSLFQGLKLLNVYKLNKWPDFIHEITTKTYSHIKVRSQADSEQMSLNPLTLEFSVF